MLSGDFWTQSSNYDNTPYYNHLQHLSARTSYGDGSGDDGGGGHGGGGGGLHWGWLPVNLLSGLWSLEGSRAISSHYTFQPRYHEQRISTFSTKKQSAIISFKTILFQAYSKFYLRKCLTCSASHGRMWPWTVYFLSPKLIGGKIKLFTVYFVPRKWIGYKKCSFGPIKKIECQKNVHFVPWRWIGCQKINNISNVCSLTEIKWEK